MLNFEIWSFQNSHLEPKGPVQVNGKSDKKCTFWAKFILREKKKKKNGLLCFSLARDLHINGKTGGWGVTVVFPKKSKTDPKIAIFVLLRDIVSQKHNCNSVSAITPCDRSIPRQKMLPMRALALFTQCID